MDRDLLYRYFEGKASPDEIHQVRIWQDLSEENKRNLQKERKLFNAIILSGMPSSLEKNKTMMAGWYRKAIVVIAASILLLFGITRLFHLLPSSNESLLVYQTINVPSGQHIDVLLPDSTQVWLNSKTKIRYPLTFLKDKREVYIDGEAYFKVKHNDKIPFVVHAGQLNIKVLGTTFDVEAYSDQSVQQAALIQGRVEVEANKQKYMLTPGRKIRLQDSNVYLESISDYDAYKWKDGLYCFTNKSITDIMKDFEKIYGIQIKITNAHIRNATLTGKFRISEGIDDALNIMQCEVEFTYRHDGQANLIYIE